MIKRDKVKEDLLLKQLAQDVPEFLKLEEFDYLIYNEYDSLGTFLLRLIDDFNKENEIITRKIFKHLNSIFNLEDELITNIIIVCVFELLTTNKCGYTIAQKFMSKEMYQYFIKEFPYAQYKDSWDTSNYYTEEEYQRILNLPDVEEDE